MKRILSTLGAQRERESGFGMIEVVISFFLLTMIALAFIPLLINTIRDTARTTTIATATQLAGQQIEAARAVRSSTGNSPTCADVRDFLAVTPVTVVDPRGVQLQPQWAAASCPASYPGVVTAAVSIMQPGYAIPIATAVTLVFVSSAGG
ncbi:type IV pilus modification PilV family protein [Rathayibacter soli]|uniref:type IV pilus modification PilV family protein n=1 Tax=Rathayibacter soli TaxID=3144168 RepID=UPI0027E56318|nr:hypothetical protein [Glaciibacter superstes]